MAEGVASVEMSMGLDVGREAGLRQQLLGPAQSCEEVVQGESTPRQLQHRQALHRVRLQRVLLKQRQRPVRCAGSEGRMCLASGRTLRLSALHERIAQALDAVQEGGFRHSGRRCWLLGRLLRVVSQYRHSRPLLDRQQQLACTRPTHNAVADGQRPPPNRAIGCAARLDRPQVRRDARFTKPQPHTRLPMEQLQCSLEIGKRALGLARKQQLQPAVVLELAPPVAREKVQRRAALLAARALVKQRILPKCAGEVEGSCSVPAHAVMDAPHVVEEERRHIRVALQLLTRV
mmetsp:Transcript_15097/g.49190  ORF Transcript_15097/g.49190 Transcript_15097/m.49190 type:complete len:290 (-) Transcript_15097:930-1799(-)